MMPRTREVAFLALLIMILAECEKMRENDRELLLPEKDALTLTV